LNSASKPNCGLITAYSLAVLGAFLIVAGLVWLMYSYTRPEPLAEDRAAFRRKTLADVRQADADALYTPAYAWADQSKGIVRLPIKDAMALALRLWQDPAAGRSNLISRVEKEFYVPPPPPTKFD
jgi:hypothetical protein